MITIDTDGWRDIFDDFQTLWTYVAVPDHSFNSREFVTFEYFLDLLKKAEQSQQTSG